MKKPKRSPTAKVPATPVDTAAHNLYGKLMEGAFIGSFVFERAFSHMEQLLTGERWMLGGQFDEVNSFIASLKLDEFRHVAEQRKRIAKRIKELQPTVSQRAIAKAMGVDQGTVRADLGEKVRNHSSPGSKNANKNNGAAAASAEFSSPSVPSGKETARMVERRSVTTEQKQEKRAERERELAHQITALPDKKYGVILCDNEWKFEPYSEETGQDRAAANHYAVSDLQALKDREVWKIAADDCVLFMWATVPMMIEATEVMTAWGFKYKSGFVWVKPKPITGFWNRNRHELLFIGTKGKIVAPAMGTQWESVFEEPTGTHSAKPDAVLEMIEEYYPTIPKIELNRRGPARPGWDAWGAEAEITSPSSDGDAAAASA